MRSDDVMTISNMESKPRQLRLLSVIASVALLPMSAAWPQSHADSVALMRAIGGALRADARQVQATIVCYERPTPCPTIREGAADVFMTELSRATGAAVVNARSDVLPPCPWGYDPPQAGAGFRVGVSTIRFDSRGDSAHVTVLQRCANRRRAVHGSFAQDFEYRLARQPGGEWKVLDRRLIRIT